MPQGVQSEGVFYQVRDAAERRLEAVVEPMPHPNIITGRWRTALAAAGLAVHPFSKIGSAALYGANGVLDWFDGMKARVGNMRTQEGERLDPLIDKIINGAYLAYLGALHTHDPAFCAAAAANIVADYCSQRARGPVIEQLEEGMRATLHPESCTPVDPDAQVSGNRAVFAGKLKFLLQNLAVMGMLAAGSESSVEACATAALCGSAALGVIGTLQRRKIKKVLASEAVQETAADANGNS